MKKINLAIVDDDYLIVTLLKSFFCQSEFINVVFENTDGNELFKYIDAESSPRIDILILDLKMKNIDGLEILDHLKNLNSSIKTIVVSSHYQDNSIGFMLKKGIAAFLPKGISPFDLLDIVKCVHQSGYYFTELQLQLLRDQISEKSPKLNLEEDLELSDRELEILKLVCKQKTAKEIGEILFITQRTVEGHKNNLFSRLGVKNVAGLIIYVLQKKILTLEELTSN